MDTQRNFVIATIPKEGSQIYETGPTAYPNRFLFAQTTWNEALARLRYVCYPSFGSLRIVFLRVLWVV